MPIDLNALQLQEDLNRLAENHGYILGDEGKKQLYVAVSQILMDQPSRTVYVVTWKPQGVGGFDWFWKEEDAKARLDTWSDEDQAELSPVQIPAVFSPEDDPDGGTDHDTADEVTDWIDTWWYDR
jgi:hypothetical protein